MQRSAVAARDDPITIEFDFVQPAGRFSNE
jgi:hypothetical protein